MKRRRADVTARASTKASSRLRVGWGAGGGAGAGAGGRKRARVEQEVDDEVEEICISSGSESELERIGGSAVSPARKAQESAPASRRSPVTEPVAERPVRFEPTPALRRRWGSVVAATRRDISSFNTSLPLWRLAEMTLRLKFPPEQAAEDVLAFQIRSGSKVVDVPAETIGFKLPTMFPSAALTLLISPGPAFPREPQSLVAPSWRSETPFACTLAVVSPRQAPNSSGNAYTGRPHLRALFRDCGMATSGDSQLAVDAVGRTGPVQDLSTVVPSTLHVDPVWNSFGPTVRSWVQDQTRVCPSLLLPLSSLPNQMQRVLGLIGNAHLAVWVPVQNDEYDLYLFVEPNSALHATLVPKASLNRSAMASLADTIFHNRRLVLGLDLDQTLVFAKVERRSLTPPKGWIRMQLHEKLESGLCVWVRKRPYVDQFLKSLAGKYDVVILSAGEPEYVREILTTFGWDGTGVTSGYPSISWRAVRPVLTKNVLTCKTMGQVHIVGDLKWFQRYQAVLKPVSMAQFFVVLVDDRSEVWHHEQQRLVYRCPAFEGQSQDRFLQQLQVGLASLHKRFFENTAIDRHLGDVSKLDCLALERFLRNAVLRKGGKSYVPLIAALSEEMQR